jgi:hypothetical protein
VAKTSSEIGLIARVALVAPQYHRLSVRRFRKH